MPLEAGALEVIAKLDCSLPEGEAATLSNEKAGESSCLSMDKGAGDVKLDADSSADSSSPLIQQSIEAVEALKVLFFFNL